MSEKAVKTSVSIDSDLVDFIDKEIGKKRFASRSHAVNFALQQLKDKFDKE